jgi:hypothetical protein
MGRITYRNTSGGDGKGVEVSEAETKEAALLSRLLYYSNSTFPTP